MRNPYHVLSVSKGDDADVIKKAYKKLARKYHPDINDSPEASEKFKEVNEAWDVLSDDKKRKLYDQFGEAGLKGGFAGGGAEGFRGGFPGGFRGGMGGVDMEDLIGSIFGAGAGRRAPARGADQRAKITIEPLMAFTGGETSLQLRQPDGQVERLNLKVPAGVRDGTTLRLKGKGHPSRGGGPCGDLHIQLTIPDHPMLRRDGDNLEMDVPVTILEAIEGAQIEVPTPTGSVRVTIPPGTPSGRKLRLKGRGVQTSNKGDLYLVIRPTVPSGEQPDLVEAARLIAEAHTDGVRDGLKL